MQRISITNPQNIIDGTAKKYYFKLRNTGGPKGDKGDKGDTGATGPQGPQGNAATVSVGSTTTLPVGYDATVTNSGSIYNAVLDFGIPQGPQGPQGAKGDKGDTGAKGDTGPRGPQGERGTNATVYVGTTTTTNPGTQARVYNSGTGSNAVLNFEIPRGDVGPQPELVQTTGTSTTKAMSQKATTDALNTKQATISSSNKLSADLVTDTNATNKFVTAEDKTTWNAKQNALTAGQGIDITSDVISTPAIVPEVVASLPAEGTEGKLYLTPKAHTTSTATGNHITASVAEQAGKLESFQLDGDTFQQTYTGQNLYNVAKVSTGTYVTKDDEGWITITRDNTSGSSTVYTNVWTSNLALETSTAYKIFIEVKAVSGTGSLFITSTNSTQGQFSSWQEKKLANMVAGQTYTVTPTTKSSFSGITQGLRTVLEQTAGQGGSVTFRLSVCASSTPTETFSYEPYTGGQASPNPDYPQTIQTVTGEQTVTIVGKNLLGYAEPSLTRGLTLSYNQSTGAISATGTTTANWAWIDDFTPIKPLPAGTYTFSTDKTRNYNVALRLYTDSTTYSSASILSGSKEATKTVSSDIVRVAVLLDCGSGYAMNDTFELQMEVGELASSFAPYHATSYPISLGSIELCKLGTYQDYIYKDGDDWKVHKATKTIYLKDITWLAAPTSVSGKYRMRTGTAPEDILAPADNNTKAAIKSSVYGVITAGDTYAASATGISVQAGTPHIFIYDPNYNALTSPTSFTQKMASTNATAYYALSAATDTAITDTDLIAQLEAIRTASLENGTNTITNTATGSNLAGDMEIDYYGYNPTNRYDKFIWLDLNNAYEQLNNPDTSSTLSTLSTRSLGTTTEQTTVTRSLETETITLKKGETEPVEDKTELPTILDEETETTEPEESDGTDER